MNTIIWKAHTRAISSKKVLILWISIVNVGSNLGLCSTIIRKKFVKVHAARESVNVVKHVIMDGLENFREEDRRSCISWLEKGRSIVRHSRGYLWLFFDDKQINHNFYSGMPDERERVPLKCLTKVVRNSQRIMEYASKHHEHGTIPFEMGHDFKGEHVEERSYRNDCQISTLREIIKSIYSEGYNAGHIAILYGDKKAIPPNLESEFPLERIGKAACNEENRLVVSTFHKYSGLERPVVILVNVASDCPELGKNAMYCCTTRAMVKLIVLTQE